MGPFTRYDFNEPLALPQELIGAFDAVAADPALAGFLGV